MHMESSTGGRHIVVQITTGEGEERHRGVVVKLLDCGREVNEFELQSRYYVHSRVNTLEKGTERLIPPPAMSKIVSLLFFYKGGFGIN